MCAEIYDVFVFCSLSGRTRASWGNVQKIISNDQINWISRIRWMHTRDGADKERESKYARPQKREQSISGHSLMPNPI